MDHEDFADEIRDLNLSYLILAQRMVQRDPASAAVKLGLEAETARWLAALPPAKLVRMASLQIGLMLGMAIPEAINKTLKAIEEAEK